MKIIISPAKKNEQGYRFLGSEDFACFSGQNRDIDEVDERAFQRGGKGAVEMQ